jgi:hypothetical protein
VPRLQEIDARAKTLKKVPRQERDRLAAKYGPPLQASLQQLTKEVMRVRGVPGGKDVLAELSLPKEPKEK